MCYFFNITLLKLLIVNYVYKRHSNEKNSSQFFYDAL